MAERKTLGIGMLGAGWMGKAHSNAYHTSRYIFWPKSNWQPRLITIGGIDEAEGKQAAAKFAYENGVAGYREIIDNPDIDIFDNVTPDPMHVEPTIEAALSGKHVVCEKPLAVRSEDARRMLEAVRKTGVKNLCCFCYRFLPAVRLAYELIQQGALGKIYHFSGTYHQDHGSAEETPAEDVWYVTGSGISQGITSHLIDMARFLIGEISTVNGMVSVYNKTRDSKSGPIEVANDEGFFGMLEFTNGITGVLQSLGVANGRRSQLAFEIYGSKGSILWDVQEPNFLHVYLSETANPKVIGFTKVCVTEPNHPFMDVWWPKGHTLGWEHAHVNMLAHFLDCVADDKDVSPLGATFEDGYKVSVIIETLKQSARQGRKLVLEY